MRVCSFYLTLNVKVTLIPNGKGSGTTPTTASRAPAATKSEIEWPYVSVAIDDPSLPATIYAHLIEDEVGSKYRLIWSRSKPSA